MEQNPKKPDLLNNIKDFLKGKYGKIAIAAIGIAVIGRIIHNMFFKSEKVQ